MYIPLLSNMGTRSEQELKKEMEELTTQLKLFSELIYFETCTESYGVETVLQYTHSFIHKNSKRKKESETLTM